MFYSHLFFPLFPPLTARHASPILVNQHGPKYRHFHNQFLCIDSFIAAAILALCLCSLIPHIYRFTLYLDIFEPSLIIFFYMHVGVKFFQLILPQHAAALQRRTKGRTRRRGARSKLYRPKTWPARRGGTRSVRETKWPAQILKPRRGNEQRKEAMKRRRRERS